MKSINWNQLSELGLIERINSEILHPLGLAVSLTVLDSSKTEGAVSDNKQRTRLRELRVEAGKLDIFADFRQIVIDECGQVLGFAEIPYEVADRIIPKIEQLVSDVQEGKVTK